MDEATKDEIRNQIKNMNFRELAMFNLKMREKMTKDGIRKEGCPVWDELTEDVWSRAANGEIDEATWVEENRKITEKETDAIIVASFGTFSTGINIRNLHNIIFASPSKSKIRNLQSIGRGLRKGDNKKEAVLFDIADDLSYKSYTNYTLKHFKERISQYNEQQFKYSMFHIRM